MECTTCGGQVEDDGVERVRKRGRRCRGCRNERAQKLRKSDPVQQLAHRWRSTAKKLWPNAHPVLCSVDTVNYVYARWNSASVISGVADIEHLTVSYYRPKTEQPPPVTELVLLTSKEAMRLARLGNGRCNEFPDAIREAMYDTSE